MCYFVEDQAVFEEAAVCLFAGWMVYDFLFWCPFWSYGHAAWKTCCIPCVEGVGLRLYMKSTSEKFEVQFCRSFLLAVGCHQHASLSSGVLGRRRCAHEYTLPSQAEVHESRREQEATSKGRRLNGPKLLYCAARIKYLPHAKASNLSHRKVDT